jgi:hypothetical protein
LELKRQAVTLATRLRQTVLINSEYLNAEHAREIPLSAVDFEREAMSWYSPHGSA